MEASWVIYMKNSDLQRIVVEPEYPCVLDTLLLQKLRYRMHKVEMGNGRSYDAYTITDYVFESGDILQ